MSGIKTSWNNLLAGRCGVVSLRDRSPEYEDLPSKVAAVVPQATAEPGGWNPAEWLAMGVGLPGSIKAALGG